MSDEDEKRDSEREAWLRDPYTRQLAAAARRTFEAATEQLFAAARSCDNLQVRLAYASWAEERDRLALLEGKLKIG